MYKIILRQCYNHVKVDVYEQQIIFGFTWWKWYNSNVFNDTIGADYFISGLKAKLKPYILEDETLAKYKII